MILVDDKQNEALEARRLAEEQANQEPPPTYSSLQHSVLTSAQSLQLSTRGSPTNFFTVARGHDQVKETLTIDPNLYIPPSLLSPLPPDETEETRKHVRIESTHGSVNATVNIVPVLGAERCKIRMYMRSVHGGVFARINGPESRHPFHLVANSTYGNVTLRLPRSFRGPITISIRHGSVKFSDDFDRHLTTFGEANHVRHCFVGDLSHWRADSGVDWGGDEIVIEAKYGGVKIQYEDDAPGSVVRARPSLLSRVFGF